LIREFFNLLTFNRAKGQHFSKFCLECLILKSRFSNNITQQALFVGRPLGFGRKAGHFSILGFSKQFKALSKEKGLKMRDIKDFWRDCPAKKCADGQPIYLHLRIQSTIKIASDPHKNDFSDHFTQFDIILTANS
jgi:hypothetical protein